VWRRVIEVNLVGCYLTCRSVVPQMIKAGYGRIVNIASWPARRQSERLALQRVEGGPDRPDQVAGQGNWRRPGCWSTP